MAAQAGDAESATLLQDTVDQFEKVIDLERTLLRKSIRKLEHDLEEVSTELGMKEEELVVWEEKVQQIQQDNEVKLCLAKARFDSVKWRGRPKGRIAPAGGSTSLGLIAEVEEGDEGVAEGDEEEDDEAMEDLPPLERNKSIGDLDAAVNALADIVAGELAALRKQWQELDANTKGLATPAGEAPQAQPAAPSANGRPGRPGAGPGAGQANPLLNERSRLTVEERIDRLQRDIRTETDRILQERGTPSATGRLPRAAAGSPALFPVASSADGGSTPVTSSSGSLAASVGNFGQHALSKPGSGLRTPVQASSRGGPLQLPPRDQDSAGSSVAPATAPGSPTSTMGVGSHASMMPGGGGKAGGFTPIGSVVRCVSPSGGAVPQVGRGRAPQFLQGRSVTSSSPTVRSVDAQASAGSSSGPPRWAATPVSGNAGYSASKVQAAAPAPAPAQQPQAPAAASTSSSPPPPVIGASGILGSRGSSGSPNGAPRATFAANRR